MKKQDLDCVKNLFVIILPDYRLLHSKNMKKLLKSGKFNSGKRPSEHVISEKGFLTDNHGSISHNVLELEQINEDKELRLPYSMYR